MIDAVVDAYRNDAPMSLAERTHDELPWIEARDGLESNASSTQVMSLEKMMTFFSKEDGPRRPVSTQNVDDNFVPVDDEFMQSEMQRWAGLLERLA